MPHFRDRIRGPVVPPAGTRRPLGVDDVEIDGGPFGRWRRIEYSHETYCAGHLVQAAVAAVGTGCGEEAGASPLLRPWSRG